jgi:hypothetical protein
VGTASPASGPSSSGGPAKKKIVAGREISLAPEQLDAFLSGSDEGQEDPAGDTLKRLRQAVADHQTAEDDAGADARLAVILGLCDVYLDSHADKSGKWAGDKVAAVEDIKAEAMVERGRRQAEARYLQDAYAAADPNQASTPTPMTAQTPRTLASAHQGAQALAQDSTLTTVQGADEETLKMVQKYKLTEAEVLAVKVYTSDDYKYINPATANSQDWMKVQKFAGKPEDYLESEEGRAEMKRFFEEGSLHGAMAIAALQKLDDKVGTCYRGDRLTPEQFEERYGNSQAKKLPSRTLTNLTSIARNEDSAREFANGNDNSKATVSVMTEIQVQHGREIRDLSVFGRGEEEWLLLPGAVIQTVSWEELPPGDAGSPQATKWVRVEAMEG